MNKAEHKRKNIPFWSWNNDLNVEELDRQIRTMNKYGFGGFIMHARSGLKTEYLGEDWMKCVKYCCEKAKDNGMEAWLYDENGWPSGIAGGKLLKDKGNKENYLTMKIGVRDCAAFVCYDISGEELCLATEDRGEKCLNVYLNTSDSTVDILDGEVVRNFIRETHEKYQEYFSGKLSENVQAIFTDEPQYYAKANPYPHKIEEYFAKEYGENIRERLGLLFVEKKGYRDFRYKYRRACQALMLKNYARQVFEWCTDNGIMLSGHYVEERDLFSQILFNGGIMPFYEYLHIPGIDWLCRRFMSVVPAKQAGSVAAQLRKKEVVSESFAMTGWDVTPREMKTMAEYQFVYGVNRLCFHLYPYSESGNRKYDYPAHFSSVNPWTEIALAPFNDYFDKLSDLFLNTEEPVNTAVLHPVRSAYFDYKQGDMDSTAPLDKGFLEFCDCLASKHIAFHFLDETLLEKYGSVDSKSIVCGAGRYDYLIIPPQAITLSESTAKLLREFVSEGGKLFVAGEIPTYLEGEKFNFDYLFSNVGLNEILIDQPYRLTSDKGVHSVYRKGKNCDFIFAVNITDRPIECEIAVPNKIVRYYDLNKRCATGLPVQTFVIKENSSVIFCTEQVGAKYYDAFLNAIERNDDKPKNYIRFDFSRMRVVSRSENILPLDFASYSFDGINYSERLSVRGIFQKFLEDRVDGEVYLKFVFESKIIPANISLLLEKDEYNAVTINGKEIDFGQFRNENYDMRRLNLQSYCVAGRNEIVLKTRFFQSEYVYYVLFDEKVTEGMKNSLVYDTYFDTIYLKGDFGVFGDTEQGKNDGVILAKNLYIDRVKEEIGSLLFDGFMFFAGKMILEKEIYLDCAETILIFSKRIHYAKIWLNDKNVGELLFDNVIDVSSAAKRGKNKIKLELYTGARNLYGPHHDAENEESFMVSPDNFTKSGWKDGKNKLFREEYALIKTEFEGE